VLRRWTPELIRESNEFHHRYVPIALGRTRWVGCELPHVGSNTCL
jgi:hypothetical protein